MEPWKDFFIAEVGASAALAGLFVVAISINVTRIIATQHLSERASQSLFTIGYVLLLTSFGLFPGITPPHFGFAALFLASILITSTLRFLSTGLKLRGSSALRWVLSPVITSFAVAIPLVIGGLYLVTGHEVGLYWIGASILMGFITTLQNGWVLMVEILR